MFRFIHNFHPRLVFVFGAYLCLLLSGCKGEKYNISKAVPISSSHFDSLYVDYAIRENDIIYDESQYYKGNFKEISRIRARGIASNFIIGSSGQEVYYISDNAVFFSLKLSGKSQKVKAKIKLPTKIKNINNFNTLKFYITQHPASDTLFAVSSSLGELFYVNLESKSVVWSKNIEGIFTSMPFFDLKNHSLIVYTALSNPNVFDLTSGNMLWSYDGRGLAAKFRPFFLPADNMPHLAGEFLMLHLFDHVSYFDLKSRSSVFEITYGGAFRDSSEVSSDSSTSEQIIQAPYIIGNGKMSVLTTNKGIYFRDNFLSSERINLWSYALNIGSNIEFAGGYIFFATGDGKLVCTRASDGKVKWISDLTKDGSEGVSIDQINDHSKKQKGVSLFSSRYALSDLYQIRVGRFFIFVDQKSRIHAIDSRSAKQTSLNIKDGSFISRGSTSMVTTFKDSSGFMLINNKLYMRDEDRIIVFE